MQCRSGCGACCIAPSINKPYFGMPNGKPAGVMCVHLDPVQMTCAIWGSEHYPMTCRNFQAERSVCGDNREEAIAIINILEQDTGP